MTSSPERTSEAALEPRLPIVDAHHHLWPKVDGNPHYTNTYLVPEFAADASGHNVVATVFIDCAMGYRREGPQELRSVGETEFARAQGEASDHGAFGEFRACAGIVSWADLTLGPAAGPVLDAHIEAGGGRFRGVRARVNRCDDPAVPQFLNSGRAELLQDSGHKAGAAELARRGLSLDLVMLQNQLPEVAAFADAVPDLTIVLNHLGGRMGVGRFGTPEGLAQWKAGLVEAAKRPNVVMKLGGFGMEAVAPDLPKGGAATSAEMASVWTPLFQACAETFGPDRCMFESNFPVDRDGGGYREIWNAFKIMSADYSPTEREAMFSGVARRTYRLSPEP